MRADQWEIANEIHGSYVVSPMKCKCVAFVSNLTSGIIEKLILANVILRLRVDLRLEEVILKITTRVWPTEDIGCLNSVGPLGMFLG